MPHKMCIFRVHMMHTSTKICMHKEVSVKLFIFHALTLFYKMCNNKFGGKPTKEKTYTEYVRTYIIILFYPKQHLVSFLTFPSLISVLLFTWFDFHDMMMMCAHLTCLLPNSHAIINEERTRKKTRQEKICEHFMNFYLCFNYQIA